MDKGFPSLQRRQDELVFSREALFSVLTIYCTQFQYSWYSNVLYVCGIRVLRSQDHSNNHILGRLPLRLRLFLSNLELRLAQYSILMYYTV